MATSPYHCKKMCPALFRAAKLVSLDYTATLLRRFISSHSNLSCTECQLLILNLVLIDRYLIYALVAQLDRATDYESVGREFESLQARHFFNPITATAVVGLFVSALNT